MGMRMCGKFSAFLRDERGSMAVEFMIWLPLITFWLVFSTAVFIAWDNRADAAKATFTIADIMSRRVTVDAGFLEQVYNLNQRLITNVDDRGDSPIRRHNILRISSVMRNSDGDLEVQWSCSMHGPTANTTTPSVLQGLVDQTIPTSVIPTMAVLDSVLVVESFVPYIPITIPFANALFFDGRSTERALNERPFNGAAELEWSSQIAIRPRLTRAVSLEDNVCP